MKLLGKIVFRDYRLNKYVSIVFSNKIFGTCVVCLNDYTMLTHYQTCGHTLCVKCARMVRPAPCIICRRNNLITSS
ncbi:MAG: hypothetical protein E6K54_08135 [Gammaproteobacteria bacterium]|nr:MAG: hypothetical protein E6K54_08135 [Gammaproteobacteria bacterium]